MGEYKNDFRKGNNRNFRNNRRPYISPEERERREKEKQEKIQQQVKNLQIIADTAAYLDTLLKNGLDTNIKMKEILDYLNTKRGYNSEETKVISQFNYIMMDLCNAQRNPRINGNRINIRVLYLQERLTSSYKKELHESINEIIKTYDHLFHWDEESNGEGYKLNLETPMLDALKSSEAAFEEKENSTESVDTVEEFNNTVEDEVAESTEE